jgi:TDG/mug DNA glycosylase family protein
VSLTRQELESFRGATVADLIGPDVRLLFVGINPGLWTAATQTHFNHPGNRFYPALYAAGLIDIVVDRGRAMTDAERQHLVARGIGITNLVARATARADELGADELRAGATRLAGFVAAHQPQVVAVAGITAYRTGFGRPKAVLGRQDETLAGRVLWVVPNPSGLNAHATIATLAVDYRAAGEAAGIALVR